MDARGALRSGVNLSAATSVVGVIGDPVAHSLSPLLHNVAFAALGIDWVSVGFPVPAGQADQAVLGAGALGVRGLSVTMPHKDAAAVLADRRTPLADLLGAVNCLIRRDDRWVGDNTDGPGLVAALRRGDRFEPEGRRCLVVGAGGAARAVVAALAGAGASEVVVVNRSPARGAAAAMMAGPVGRLGEAAEAAGCDLVVNATSVGMVGATTSPSATSGTESFGGEPPAWPVDPALLHAGQMVVDLVYHPVVTPWLAAAAERGAQVANGLGMLVHQAALQLTAWTGLDAPVEAMWAAVGDRVGGVGGGEGPVGRALSS
jgi:shikimate dehydrogenase